MNTAKTKVFIGLYHENCYLLGVNWPLVGGKNFGRERGFFQVGGMSKFAAAGAYSICLYYTEWITY